MEVETNPVGIDLPISINNYLIKTNLYLKGIILCKDIEEIILIL